MKLCTTCKYKSDTPENLEVCVRCDPTYDKHESVENTKTNSSTADWIEKTCNDIKELLLSKNKHYGNSALNPLQLFSKASVEEQLKVAIDHKISRIMNAGFDGDSKEDSLTDLIGYLILLKIHKSRGA